MRPPLSSAPSRFLILFATPIRIGSGKGGREGVGKREAHLGLPPHTKGKGRIKKQLKGICGSDAQHACGEKSGERQCSGEVTVNSTPSALWEHKELGGIFSLSRQIQSGRGGPVGIVRGLVTQSRERYPSGTRNGGSATRMGSKTKTRREEKDGEFGSQT